MHHTVVPIIGDADSTTTSTTYYLGTYVPTKYLGKYSSSVVKYVVLLDSSRRGMVSSRLCGGGGMMVPT